MKPISGSSSTINILAISHVRLGDLRQRQSNKWRKNKQEEERTADNGSTESEEGGSLPGRHFQGSPR